MERMDLHTLTSFQSHYIGETKFFMKAHLKKGCPSQKRLFIKNLFLKFNNYEFVSKKVIDFVTFLDRVLMFMNIYNF